MAIRLDDMLDSGERVIYRAPRRWLPSGLIGIIICYGLYVVLDAIFNFDGGRIETLIVVIGLLYLFKGVRSFTAQAVVTDRRLLHKPVWPVSEITEIPLSEIKEVTNVPGGLPGYVKIAKDDGKVECIAGLGRPQPLARAVARAAGVREPLLVGRMENVAESCILVGGLPCAMTLMYIIYMGFPLLERSGLEEIEGWSIAGWAVLILPLMFMIFAIGVIVGTYLASWVAMPLMRPFVPFEDMQAWLCGESESEAAKKLSRWTKPLSNCSCRWAGVLYGRPFQCSDRSEGSIDS